MPIIKDQGEYDRGKALVSTLILSDLNEEALWDIVHAHNRAWMRTNKDFYLGVAEAVQDMIWRRKKAATA